MQSKSKNENQIEANTYNISPSTVCGEPWWRSAGYSSISPAVMRGNVSNSSSLEQSMDGQSQSDGGFNEEDDDATKESENTAPSSEGNYGQGHRDPQHIASNIPPRNDESITQTPQLELVGHSIACASNPYCDPYYGGMMAAYGHPLVYPHHLINNMNQPRLPLPLEMAPEPVFVNAKQYNGILRRRQSRAKAELEKKLIKDRKPYLHESRHQHAMRRARASGGRFAKKSNVDGSKNTGEEKGTGCSSASSSGPEHSQPTYANNNNNGRCENRDSFEGSAYGGDRGEGGSGGQQQWGSLRSSQAPQRAVAMQ